MSKQDPHLHARSVAWPWTDPRAFRHAVVAMDSGSDALLQGGLHDELRLHLRNRSLAEVDQIRRLAWYGSSPEPVRLTSILFREATIMLRVEGGKIRVRPEQVAAMSWARFFLPVPLWAVAAAVADGQPMTRWEITAVTPGLEKVLKEGIAETHQHFLDAGDAVDRWTGWMVRMPMLSLKEGAQQLPADVPGGRAGFIGGMLVAALLRLNLERRLSRSAGDCASTWWDDVEEEVSKGDISALNPYRLRERLRKRVGIPPKGYDQSPESLYAADPLYRQGLGYNRPEVDFWYNSLHYLQRVQDRAYETLFHQYIRLFILFFRYATQEPGTRGIAWFQRFFDRGRKLRLPPGWALKKAMGEPGPHRALELRTSPPVKREHLQAMLTAMARESLQLSKQHRPREFALLLHLVKGKPEPRESLRWLRWARSSFAQMRCIESTLKRRPEGLLLLRGLDLAGTELDMPLWPALPFLRRLRRFSERVSALLQRVEPGRPIPGFRMTLHAGEDFRHPVEGLRRMHELVESGLYRAGDRIGHGLALVMDAAGQLMPAEEVLDDLMWEWDRYGKGELEPASERPERLVREIRGLSRLIYGEEFSEEILSAARGLRWSTAELARCGWNVWSLGPEEPMVVPTSKARSVLQRYLSDRSVRKNGAIPYPISAEQQDPSFLQKARNFVRSTLAHLEIAIETNPSSNHLIANMDRLEERPIFRLVPISGPAPDGLLVSVNTDDPATFVATLPDEYGLLYHAMLERGVSSLDALAWMERVRRAGMYSRFSLEESLHPDLLGRVAQ